MNEISCDVCMDLIPLVRDGIASPDSEEAVRRHLETCPSCKAFYNGETPPPSDSKTLYRKLRQQLRVAALFVMMLGLLFGLSLSGDGSFFYNVLLMPALGAVGYYLFRWKAVIEIPVLLFVTHFVMNALGMAWKNEHLDLASLLVWSALYAGFALVGTVIAGLLHFALRKENGHEEKNA